MSDCISYVVTGSEQYSMSAISCLNIRGYCLRDSNSANNFESSQAEFGSLALSSRKMDVNQHLLLGDSIMRTRSLSLHHGDVRRKYHRRVHDCDVNVLYHREQSQRVGYWFLMNGSAQIISGGILEFWHLTYPHECTPPVAMVHDYHRHNDLDSGSILLVKSHFAYSPANAWFLTLEERKIAVERIKVNQTGIGNKQFKWEQVAECLKEPKTWLFAMFSLLDNIPNSLTNQRSIIINGFGFSVLQTTLLGCVNGSIEIITIFTGVTLAARYKDSIAWVGIIYFVPNVLGSILVNTLPAHNKVGLLCSYWITGVGTTGFVLSLSWVTAVTAGHTKRITMNAIMLCAYCIGNIVGPQMWQARFSPRNRVPWGIISAIRTILSHENKRRDAEAETQSNDSEDLYIEEILADGTKVERTFGMRGATGTGGIGMLVDNDEEGFTPCLNTSRPFFPFMHDWIHLIFTPGSKLSCSHCSDIIWAGLIEQKYVSYALAPVDVIWSWCSPT
ncbi:hypothetical protein BU17DRAFT_64892 [Hysterangium stoloniferum]|nr:hypothetical protein BU17DRAFT_64892 [Hysterangium stoloniferum]